MTEGVCKTCGVTGAVYDETGNCPAELPEGCVFEAPEAAEPPYPFLGRRAREHRVKCWPEPFRAMRLGLKPFEFRKSDRDYQVGDTFVACEWDPRGGGFTGQELRNIITYKLINGLFGVPDGYCVLGLSR